MFATERTTKISCRFCSFQTAMSKTTTGLQSESDHAFSQTLYLSTSKKTFKHPASLQKGCTSNLDRSHAFFWMTYTIHVFVSYKEIWVFLHRMCNREKKRLKILPVNSKVNIRYISVKLHRYLMMNRKNREHEAQFPEQYTECFTNIIKAIKYF